MIDIELGDTKEIRPLVAASSYSAMNLEIRFQLISLLLSCRLRVKLAQIDTFQNDDGHKSV